MKKHFALLGIFLLLPYLAACGWISNSAAPAPSPIPENQASPEYVPLAALPPGSAIRFETLNIEDGLSQSVVNAIVQDHQGFVWLGTQDGLNRYDGNIFKVYKPQPGKPNSLSDAWITELFVDKDDYLWAGTHQGGLNRYDPGTGTFTRYLHNPDDLKSLTAGEIQAIYQDRAGAIWVGTENGLNRFDPADGTFTHYINDPGNSASLSSNAVTDIYQDSRGNLWIGTMDGLNLFNPAEDSFVIYRNDPAAPRSLSFDAVAAIVEDEKGGLWVGTDKGLNLFDYASGTFTRYTRDPIDPSSLGYDNICDLLVDRNGTLWIGTDFGLDRFDAEHQKFIHYRHDPLVRASLSENIIFTLYEDRGGVLWIGTWGGGVSKYDRGQEKFAYYRYEPGQINGLPEGGIWAIAPEKSGQVWLGGFGSGLMLFDPATGQVKTTYLHDEKKTTSLSSSMVYSILRDSRGVLWVGTAHGLNQFDEQSNSFLRYTADDGNPDSISGNQIYKIYEDSTGGIWVGTRRGLDFYDRQSEKIIHYSDSKSNKEQDVPVSVSDILEDRNGNDLWVTTFENGLYRLDRVTGTFEHFQYGAEKDTIANNIVLGVSQDKQGLLWLSYGGGGLSKFDSAAGKFTTYTELDGLPNNFVYCAIHDEQGNLWLSTNYGISKFNPRLETFENFTTSDGLQSNEFNQGACARGPDQAIYFGGGAGLNRFFPGKIFSSNYLPPIAMTSVTFDGNPLEMDSTVETTREITLEWPKNSFEFEFVALSFAESQKNQYAYKLENFDSGWNSINHKRDGRYTNLPGGEYILHLKAANSDGIWNETGTSIKVTIIPPFWQTWWFYTFIIFLGAGVIWAGYQVRLRSIVSRRQELERQVSERTREIERLFEQTKELAVIEERNRLARELHDSAKQKAFAALAQLGTANGLIQNNTKAAKIHINEAENLVYDVIQELTFLIQEMYPLALKEKGLVTSLREYIFEWENRTGVRVNLQAEGEKRLSLKLEQAIYRICQEALANVARHSHASQVEITVVYHPEEVKLLVSDNGNGFDVSQKPKGIGLRSMQERAESMGGCVSISSETGKGTRVQATLPIKEDSGV